MRASTNIYDMHGKPIASEKKKTFLNGGLSNGAANVESPTLQGWNWWGGSPDDDIIDHLEIVRQRCRDLVLNAPIVAGMVKTMTTNVIGRGLIPEPTPDKEALGMTDEEAEAWKKTVLKYWEAWAESKECDARRRDNFYELQALVHRSVIESGDVFVTMPHIEYPGSRSLLDLRLQVIEADCISNPSMTTDYDRDADIHGGVEIGEYGQVIAYHIATKHPLAKRSHGHGAYLRRPEWVRVPVYGEESGRQNILHIMRSQRPGQRRGIPFLAPVVESVKVLDRYMKSELQAALVQSLFTVAIETQDTEAAIGEWNGAMTDLNPTGDNNRHTRREEFYNEHGMMEMGAGTVSFLAPGDKVTPVGVTRPAGNFGPFVEAQLKAIGAAMELPYELVAMEFKSSFSASKAAINMATRGFELQRDWMVYGFCQPTYEEFMAHIIAKGYMDAPGFFTDPLKRRAYCEAKWAGPGDLQIDARQELMAHEKAIGLGLMTYSDAAAKMGTDFRQNAEVLAEEQRLIDENPWDRTPINSGHKLPVPDIAEESEEDAQEADSQEDQGGDGSEAGAE